MPAGAQKRWDWDRESRRAALRDAKLPDKRSSDGVLVPAARLWATLVVLEDHASSRDCFPSVNTLAREARQSVRTTLRALSVLEELGLMIRERKRPWDAEACDRRTLTHYAIVWGELASLKPGTSPGQAALNTVTSLKPGTSPDQADLNTVGNLNPGTNPDQAALKPGTSPGQAALRPSTTTDQVILKPGTSPDQSAVAPYQSAVAPDQSAVAPDQSAVAPRPIRNKATPYGTPVRNPVPPTPATATGGDHAVDTGWGGVDEMLLTLGIGVRDKLMREWKATGRTSREIHQDLREVVKFATADQGRFLLAQGARDVGSAVVFRLRHGVWPFKVDQDPERHEAAKVRRVQESAAKDWAAKLHQAWRAVRANTPLGQTVDDVAVVEAAVRSGVPRAWAAAERGVGACATV